METERLVIDAIKASDKEDYFHNISHDRKVLETFVCTYVEDIEDMDVTPYVDRDGMYAIRLKETGRLIGIILYFDDNGESCEIGYGIGSEYWGRGYGTEAVERFIEFCLEEKKFKTVYASFFTGNDSSKHVMEKCGMTYDHFAEKEMVYLGQDRDLTYYSINRMSVDEDSQSDTFEKSCGAIVYTVEEGVIKYLLVQETSGFHSFPKGHTEGNETEEETALREIKEETNLEVNLCTDFREIEQYQPAEMPGVTKQVVYFLAEYTDVAPGIIRPNEVKALKSLTLEEALNTIEHDSKKELLKMADAYIKGRKL